MPKQAPEIQLAGIEIPDRSGQAKYRHLAEALRQRILDGRLSPGTRLPASRVFAAQLQVSRNTVLQAFTGLIAEGYLTGKPGSGTFVTDSLPEAFLHSQPAAPELDRQSPLPTDDPPQELELRPFRCGAPSLQDFPFALWTRVLSRQSRRLPFQAFGYGDPGGYPPLRRAVAEYLSTARAVRCQAEQILIVNGSQQAIDLCGRVLLGKEDVVWFEDPGYPAAKDCFQRTGARLFPVTVDRNGMQVELAQRQCPQAKLAYLTPSHQFPLGHSLSLSRRMQLLDWANRNGAWLLEDDYDSEYRFSGPPLASMQGLDRNDRVLYMGTFSKVFFPALRLGYLVLPPPLVDEFQEAKQLADRGCSLLEQAALAEFLEQGHFARHLRKMRLLYHRRQLALAAAARQRLPAEFRLQISHGGMHALLWLPPGENDRQVAERARQAGFQVEALSNYRLKSTGLPALLLGFAAFSEAQIQAGMESLATRVLLPV
ncbi:MAG: PLP-dependent aminotransferase family protein [Planctomycetota bacterium]|nr:MAG: PLP-dependent aminotransferase family protein [Planctomycetota bacterium]